MAQERYPVTSNDESSRLAESSFSSFEFLLDNSPSSDLTLGTSDLEHLPLLANEQVITFYESASKTYKFSDANNYWVESTFGFPESNDTPLLMNKSLLFDNNVIFINSINDIYGYNDMDLFFTPYRHFNDSSGTTNLFTKEIKHNKKYKGKFYTEILQPNLNFADELFIEIQSNIMMNSIWFNEKPIFNKILNEYAPNKVGDVLYAPPLSLNPLDYRIRPTYSSSNQDINCFYAVEFEFFFEPSADGNLTINAKRNPTTNDYKTYLSRSSLEIFTSI